MKYTRVIEWPVVSTEPLAFTGGVAWFRLMNDPSFVWRPNLIYGVKAGLLTDFASVPRLLRPILGASRAPFGGGGLSRRQLCQENCSCSVMERRGDRPFSHEPMPISCCSTYWPALRWGSRCVSWCGSRCVSVADKHGQPSASYYSRDDDPRAEGRGEDSNRNLNDNLFTEGEEPIQ